jgi:uncharacterized protein DUF1573
MLRWVLLAVVVVALTVGASLVAHSLTGSARSGLAGGGTAFPHRTEKEVSDHPAKATIVSGGEPVYEFGTMSTQATGTKEWVIKNEGTGNLMLKQGYASCSCTIAGLAEGETATVKPGEETTVKLRWETRNHTGSYGQKVKVLVMNDPDRQEFEFSVRGTVTPALLTLPQDPVIEFTNVSDGKPHSAYFVVFSPSKPDVKITGLESSRPDKMDVSFKPLTDEEHEKLGIKEGGYKVEVTMNPGMPLGEFQEAVEVKTDHPSQDRLRMLLRGHTVGPISTSPERVSMRVASSRGGTSPLTIWVRGQDETKFEVADVPKGLEVNLEPVAESAGSATDLESHAKRYRLMVKVAPGTQPGLIDGSIILKTDHPQAGEVKIPVLVAVTSAG